MKKVLAVILCGLLFLAGCKKVERIWIKPDIRVYDGYVSYYEPNPKIMNIPDGWVRITAYFHGNEDKWAEVPAGFYGVLVHWRYDITKKRMELWNWNGFFYKIVVEY